MPYPKRILWILVVSAFAWNIFAHGHEPGLGWSVFLTLIFAAIGLSFDRKLRPLETMVLSVGILASVLFAFRASGLTLFFNVLTALIVLKLLVLMLSVEKMHWEIGEIVKAKWTYLGKFLTNIPRLSQSISHHGRSIRIPGLNMRFSPEEFARTLLITVGVLLVFGVLLSRADPIFAKLFTDWNIPWDAIDWERVQRILIRIFLTLCLIIALAAGLSVRFKQESGKKTWLSFANVAVPVTCLIILLGLFLIIQAKYLFGSHANIQDFDLTYSEYVRKGFKELLMASFLGFIVCYVSTLKWHALHSPKHIKYLRVVNCILVIELFGLLISAYQRDFIYMQTYGITRIRIAGFAFLLWLTFILGMQFLLNVLPKLRERHLLAGIGIATLGCMLNFNIMNIDHSIAIGLPPPGNERDFVYIALLSEDAVDGWSQMIRDAHNLLKRTRDIALPSDDMRQELANAKIGLKTLKQSIERSKTKETSWQEWNWSRQKAMKRLTKDPIFTQGIECLENAIRHYQVRFNIDLLDQEAHRLAGYTYPLIGKSIRYGVDDESLAALRAKAGMADTVEVIGSRCDPYIQ